MPFNSLQYAAFLTGIFALYFTVPVRLRQPLLVLASYVFYSFCGMAYLACLFGVTAAGYGAGLAMERHRANKWPLLLCVLIANFGLLFVFKYLDFASFNANLALDALGAPMRLPYLKLLLPVGISFYIFQAVGYVIDVYRGEAKPEANFLRFALYVAFFPQLLAGPIGRANQLMPQLDAPRPFAYRSAVEGLKLILWGLFKKVVIADRLQVYADAIHGAPATAQGITVVVGMIFYTFEMYCDFSGYSDMARGSAALFGIELINNFDHPFHATSVSDFWRRWHISLSTWLQDYVFKPLTIATRNWGRTGLIVSVVIANFLIGIWHGANWTFAVFGLIQGAMITLEILTKKRRKKALGALRGPRAAVVATLGRFYVFTVFSLSLVFFRAATVGDAVTLLSRIGVGWGRVLDPAYLSEVLLLDEKKVTSLVLAFALIAFVATADAVQESLGSLRAKLTSFSAPLRWSVYYALAFAILGLGKFGVQKFIYFQF